MRRHILYVTLALLSMSYTVEAQRVTDSTRKRILTLAPLQVSEMGAGVGLGYEHYLGAGHKVSFYMPAYFTWNYKDNGTYYYTPTVHAINTRFEIGPGIKLNIAPVRHIGAAEIIYAIGPNLMFGFGSETNFDTAINGTKISRMLLGVMINQSLNVDVTPQVYAGVELGLGYSYLNIENGSAAKQAGLVQFSMKIGYKF